MGVMYFGVFTAALCLSPIVLFINIFQPSFIQVHWEPNAAIFVFLTVFAHMLYFSFLGAAYKIGEISVVYPIARGTGVGLTSIIAYFVLGENITWPQGWIGIWSIVFGVLLVGLGKQLQELLKKPIYSQIELKTVIPKFDETKEHLMDEIDGEQLTKEHLIDEIDEEQLHHNNEIDDETQLPQNNEIDLKGENEQQTVKDEQNFKLRSIFLAMCVGLTIAFYSISDKLGVATMDPITYAFFLELGTGIFLTPYIWLKHLDECKESVSHLKKYIALVGIISCGAYLAILFAFQLVAASYIVAIREVSVVLGSLLGFFILKETFNVFKIVGIVAITIGLILVKLA